MGRSFLRADHDAVDVIDIACALQKMVGRAGSDSAEARRREISMVLVMMILGLVLFLGAHTLTTQRGVRAR